ncbi:hypothetical protein [Pseudomonas chlororaphis]|uniref:hypothetical protein n=1 Tax=Pseudomonas chlororaphis TaxID=587753 RepID=UPI0039E3A2FE
MSIDKEKLKSLLWSVVASWRAEDGDLQRHTAALDEHLGDKTVEEVALELLAENERLKTLRSTTERDLAQELEVWKHGPSCWNCGDTGDVHDMVGEWRGQCDCNAAKLIDVASERDQLRAEVADLKTGYEAYERVNAELKADYELARMRIKEMDLLFGRYILVMRSALIEEEHGKGPAAAMEWIYNSLAGPGELPPEGEADSQAYFDREIVAVDNGMQEVMAFHEGRRAAMSKGEQP